jgi:hypothetical protein
MLDHLNVVTELLPHNTSVHPPTVTEACVAALQPKMGA